MRELRFTVKNRDGRWCVYDNVARRWYKGYSNWAQAALACDGFNNDYEKAAGVRI